jgi:peptidoglycan/xylan/chitin deacetylase (PgdA/CDA1 family)
MTKIKIYFFYLSKALGLFHLARLMTRGGLRILCYHGFTLDDEDKWLPNLFLDPAVFRRRMDYLAKKKIPVLPLSEALQKLQEGSLPPCATVITIDDGFYSTYRLALPILAEKHFPATLYLTSYYFEKGVPIFNLAVNYMFWRTKARTIDLSRLGIPGQDNAEQDILNGRRRQAIKARIQDQGDRCDSPGRSALVEKLGKALGIDYADLAESRKLNLINEKELHEMTQQGIDIQLHTHRHRFPRDHHLALKEITENRAAIEPLLDHPMRHFCYPSGRWSETQWPLLRQAGVETATICAAEKRFIYKDTPRYALPRILDGSRKAQIVFEAEICGYAELTRRFRQFLKRAH